MAVPAKRRFRRIKTAPASRGLWKQRQAAALQMGRTERGAVSN